MLRDVSTVSSRFVFGAVNYTYQHLPFATPEDTLCSHRPLSCPSPQNLTLDNDKTIHDNHKERQTPTTIIMSYGSNQDPTPSTSPTMSTSQPISIASTRSSLSLDSTTSSRRTSTASTQYSSCTCPSWPTREGLRKATTGVASAYLSDEELFGDDDEHYLSEPPPPPRSAEMWAPVMLARPLLPPVTSTRRRSSSGKKEKKSSKPSSSLSKT